MSLVISKYPRSTESHTQLASLLHDLFPEEKMEVNIVLMVYDSGISSRIAKEISISSVQFHSFIKQLIDGYGLQEEFAVLGIKIWANAYNIVIEESQSFNVGDQSSLLDYDKPKTIVEKDISEYEVEDALDEGIVITRFLGFGEKKMIVPNTINDQRVIGIGPNAYQCCSEIESLVIPEGIEFIQNGAFAGCTNLREVILPNSLKSIGSVGRLYGNYLMPSKKGYVGVFENCRFEEIKLPPNLSFLGKYTFSFCQSLRSITIPDSIKEIYDNTFEKCFSLTKVRLSKNTKRIGDEAFNACTYLSDIQFPNSLQQIGNNAFSGCHSLISVALNEGLKRIGFSAFSDCSDLTKVLMPSTVVEIAEDSGAISNDIFSVHNRYQSNSLGTNNWYVPSINPRITIYCYAGSYGLEYARMKGYPIQNATNFK